MPFANSQHNFSVRPAVFLDRDGTLTCDAPGGYTYRVDDFAFEEGAVEGLKLLQQQGFLLIITTGQSGIGRGFYGEHDYEVFTRHLLNQLKQAGVIIDAVYHCPHHHEKGIGVYKIDCSCRKPKTGMIDQAVTDFTNRKIAIDLSRSYVVGDKTDDGEMGNRAGCFAILVKCATGKRGQDGHYDCQWDFEAANLLEAASWIVSRES